jgi:hypothetical protein
MSQTIDQRLQSIIAQLRDYEELSLEFILEMVEEYYEEAPKENYE